MTRKGRSSAAATAAGALAVAVVLALVLADRRDEFADGACAPRRCGCCCSRPRCSCWRSSRAARPGDAASRRRARTISPPPAVPRRRASATSRSLVNTQLGAAARIAVLRRSRARRHPEDPGADRRRDPDHRDRGGARGAQLLHARRAARPALVGAADRARGRCRAWSAAAAPGRPRRGLLARARGAAQPRRPHARDRAGAGRRVRADRPQLARAARARRRRLRVRRHRGADRDGRARAAADRPERRRGGRRGHPRQPTASRSPRPPGVLLTATGTVGALASPHGPGSTSSAASAAVAGRPWRSRRRPAARPVAAPVAVHS